MRNKRTISLTSQDLAVAHGHDQQLAVGQKPKPRRLFGYVRECLRRSVRGQGEDAMCVEVGDVEPAFAPSRALGK